GPDAAGPRRLPRRDGATAPPRLPPPVRPCDRAAVAYRAFADRLRRERQLDDRPRRARDHRLAGLSPLRPRAMTRPPFAHRSSTEHDPLDAADGPRTAPAWQAWLEVAVLAGLVTAARMIAGLGVSWLALAPLLAGLRYGATRGVVCAAAQVAVLTAAAHWQ